MKDDFYIKPKILFIGAFNKTLDGSVGGQLHACDTLIKSEISNFVDFTFIDSTMETLPPPPLIRRAYLALKRIFIFCCKLSINRFDSILIFTSSGFGFIEKGFMVLIAKLFKLPTVLSPRSGLLVDQINRMKLMRWYVRFVLQKSDLVLCQSQSWSKFYQELTRLPSKRFVIIKNWIDPLPYFELPIQKKYSNQINVLFLGWIEKNKGIYDLVLAVKENRQLLSNYKFMICGKGSELKGLKSVISDYGLESYFKFKGWVVGEEKIDALREADIFVLPSYREGLPNALLEAMASGCAVIASSVGAIPDVIEDGKNGILVTHGDSLQLASSIIKLGSSKQLREDFGFHARKTIMDQHDINKVWEDVLNLIVQK